MKCFSILVVISFIFLSCANQENKQSKEMNTQQHILKFIVINKDSLEKFPMYNFFNGQSDRIEVEWVKDVLLRMDRSLSLERSSGNKFSYSEYFDNFLHNTKLGRITHEDRIDARSAVAFGLSQIEKQNSNPIFPLTDDNDYLNRLVFNYCCIEIFRDYWFGDNRIKFSQMFINAFIDDQLEELLYKHSDFDNDSANKSFLPVFEFAKYYEPKADNDEVLLPHIVTPQKANDIRSKLLASKERYTTKYLSYEFSLFDYMLRNTTEGKTILIIEPM